MRLLITGGLGFIGSNFILHAMQKYPKIKITNIDAQLEGSNIKNLQSLKNKSNYRYVKGNITNQKLIKKLVSQTDIVFNFAAESHVDRSIINPKPFINSNVYGTYVILEAVKKFNKKLIQISTDEVFGSLKHESASESFPLKPSSPYAASKAAAEHLVNSYYATYATDVIISRCTNNYGPRQFPEKLIPKTIILATRNKKIPIYGNGKNIRDWIFVFDHCEALCKILEKGKSGESYNISASNEISNIIIVKKILELLGKPFSLIKFVKDRPGHDYRYSLNSSKLYKKTNWKPSVSLEKGLEHTINWYLKNRDWWNKLSTKKFGRIN